MKKLYLTLTLVFFLFASNLCAQLNIHYWNFNTGAGTAAGNKWPSPISPTTSVGGGMLTHNFTNTEDFAGSTLDAPAFTTATAGAAFCVVDAANNNNAITLFCTHYRLPEYHVHLRYKGNFNRLCQPPYRIFHQWHQFYYSYHLNGPD